MAQNIHNFVCVYWGLMIMVHGMYCMRGMKNDCDNRKKVR